ncbi:MAG TPA: cyclic-di-AMP receptor [Pseudogracilibacillus sp.]|nr:cyclic-di-AMP receptor [Pseudogracilibacillus sp.]
MKLIVAIVQDNDASRLTKELGKKGFRSTKLASTGGFLRSGNTTIMIGCETDEVDKALDIIKVHCSERVKRSSTSYPMRASKDYFNMRELEIGGATVFVLPVEAFHRL